MKKRTVLILALALVVIVAAVLLLWLRPSSAPKTVAVNETNFPDENFRTVVNQYDGDRDGVLSSAELSDVTWINCADHGITSLKGIENFSALTELDCFENQLSSLDVSRNTKLIRLACSDNQLTALDVSKNTALEQLYCYNNQLTALDVSKNAALKKLICYSNRLTALEVSRNTALEVLECAGNQLTALDLRQNQNLRHLTCYGNELTVLDVSAVPGLLDALENGEKTANQEKGVVVYETNDDMIAMDLDQKTLPETDPS